MSKKAARATKTAETTDTPQAGYRPPYPGFIHKWEDLTMAYGRIEQALDSIIGNAEGPDAVFIALKALQKINEEHEALFKEAWSWIGTPETRRFFGRLTYDELMAENTRKQAEQAGDHQLQ